jgi:hypothetical protein
MPRYQVTSKDLTQVNGADVSVGDELTLIGVAARRLVADGHVKAIDQEAEEALPASDAVRTRPAAKRGAKRAEKGGARKRAAKRVTKRVSEAE